jgi:transposase
VSTLDHTLEPEAAPVRRLEVITGTDRRRRFSEDDKARVVEETLAPGAVVSAPVPDAGTEVATIEVVIGAATIRIPPGVDAAMLKLVLRAVKAAS